MALHLDMNELLNSHTITSYHSVSEELAATTNRVHQLLQQNVDAAKIAIVYPEDEYRPLQEQYFRSKNIPFYSNLNVNILEQPLIHKIIKLLCYISAEHDILYSGDNLLFEILHVDFYTIPAFEITKLVVDVNSRKRSRTPTAIRKLLLEKAHAPGKDLFDTGISKELKEVSAILEKLISDATNVSLQQLFENIILDARVLNYVRQSDERIWLMHLITALGNFIKTKISRDPRLQLNKFIEAIDTMKREAIPLPVNKITGSPNGVHIIKAEEIKVPEFDFIFIAGANASTSETDDWFKRMFKLPATIFSSLPVADFDSRDKAPLYLFDNPLTRTTPHLFISFAKYNKKGKELKPGPLVTEISSRHSIPVNDIVLTDDELKEYAILDKTKLLPEIERPGDSIITPALNKFVMNVSALNNYLNCPLGFYYKNIIRIPSGKNEAMEFGSAIHYALEKLFKKRSAVYPFSSAAEMVEDFKWYMQSRRAFFNNEAFHRRIHYGGEVLQNYYDQYINSWNTVIAVERNICGITINGVPLKGKLDKLEFNGREVNIVDYKSGDIAKALPKMRPPHDDDPNGGDYWRQAVFYKILVDNYEQKDWKAVSIEFDFIEPDENKVYRKEKILINPQDIETVTQQFTRVWEKIQARKFYTGCGREDCHWCNFVKDNKRAVKLHVKEEVEALD